MILSETVRQILGNRAGIDRLCEHQVRLASNVNVARTAPSETRGQNWIQRQFRGQTKPSKHRFRPSDQTYLFASETKRDWQQVLTMGLKKSDKSTFLKSDNKTG